MSINSRVLALALLLLLKVVIIVINSRVNAPALLLRSVLSPDLSLGLFPVLLLNSPVRESLLALEVPLYLL